MEKLEKLLESLGYGFNPMPFTQKEIAKYLKSQPEFSYISEGSIVSHYIKPKKDWKFKKGSAPKDRPSLQSVISTK